MAMSSQRKAKLICTVHSKTIVPVFFGIEALGLSVVLTKNGEEN